MARQQCIGILGGTFDPFHEGHLGMGLGVLDTGCLDRLLVIPSGDPPHKSCAASAEDRWKMVVSACSRDKRLCPDRTELDRSGTIYAVDTLHELQKAYPGASLYYLIGTDTLLTLHLWRRWEEVLRLCTFVVCRRSQEADDASVAGAIRRFTALGGHFLTVPVTPPPVSSTEIRRSLAAGLEPEGLNVSVLEYCTVKGLYGTPGRLEHIDEWIDALFAALKPSRFAHSLSVAYESKRLARLHGVDSLKAEQAGLLHDCAKCIPLPEMRRIAVSRSLTDDEHFLENDALLHSIVGASVAETDYGMKDPEVLEAIRYHNTGHTGMSRLAMCVCLADSIEPLRKSYPFLEKARALAEQSLERALLFSLESTANYVTSRGLYLHPRTRKTIRWLKSLPETSEA